MLLFCAGLLLAAPPASAQSEQQRAERLIELRGQVDELQSELDLLREEHKNQMGFLTAQAAELEANRDREQLRIRQLEQDLAEFRNEQQQAGTTSEALVPVAQAVIQTMRRQVGNGFPFKRQERLSELDEIATQLDNRTVQPQRIINRLWAFLEDELRITRENAIYSQTIRLDNQDVLADVAKIGTVMLLFRTRDERYGHVVRNGDDWTYRQVDSADDEERIEHLFDSLQKQIRQGYFQLPNAIAAIPMQAEADQPRLDLSDLEYPAAGDATGETVGEDADPAAEFADEENGDA